MSNMQNDPVLSALDKAIVQEEKAITIYTSHLKTAFQWSGLSQEQQQEIVTILNTLSRESRGHISLLEEVRGIYEQVKKETYV